MLQLLRAEAVVVAVGRGAIAGPAPQPVANARASARIVQKKLGSAPVNVFTLQAGQPPEVGVDGDAVVVGGQRFAWDGSKLRPAVFRE